MELWAPVRFYRHLCYPILQNVAQMPDNIWIEMSKEAVGWVEIFLLGVQWRLSMGISMIIDIHTHLQLELLPQVCSRSTTESQTYWLRACAKNVFADVLSFIVDILTWLTLVDFLRQPPCFSRRCLTNLGPRAAHSCRDSVQGLPIKSGYPHPKWIII